MQRELHNNKCRSKRIDVWQQAVDTQLFNPRFRTQEMRERLSGGHPNKVILTYVGRLGAGARPSQSHACTWRETMEAAFAADRSLSCCDGPAEKNLKALREIMLDLPDNVCLAFVGDGPIKGELE